MRSRRILALAIAAGSLIVLWCVRSGSAASGLAVAFFAFALMIGAPIAVLAWLGSLTDSDERRRARQSRLKSEQAHALLWRQTLLELEAPAWPHPLGEDESVESPPGELSLRMRVASALAPLVTYGKRIRRSILALLVGTASVVGHTGCGVPAEAWAMVRPGMSTADLVAIAGGPDYVRSNGVNEIWQYCRDLRLRDESWNARYYTAVLVDKQTVQDVRPYPVLSSAGCEDFYRANF